jgi:sphingomyelin phosphodiesterase 2
VESAQWIKLSSSSADLTVYAGDFNTEPKDIPYKIVRHVTPLRDAWIEANGVEGGESSETAGNSYTARSALKECPAGKRIDYIMYNSGPNVTAQTLYCALPLPDRIPGKTISFSDHEGVAARIRIKRREDNFVTSRDFVRQQSLVEPGLKTACVQEAMAILRTSLKDVRLARILYLLGALLCFVLLIGAFIVPVVESHMHVLLDILLFVVRSGILVVIQAASSSRSSG